MNELHAVPVRDTELHALVLALYTRGAPPQSVASEARAAPPAVHSAPCRPTRRGAARQTLESFYYIFSLMVSP